MAYRSIAASETNPGAPGTQSLMRALAENPGAVAEAAAGAPRIVTEALLAPQPGNVVIARWYGGSDYVGETANSLYPDPHLGRQPVDSRSVGFMILVPGRIRAAVDHRTSMSGEACQVRVVLNGDVVQAWSSVSESWAERTVDFNVATGDVVTFQQRRAPDANVSALSRWRRPRIMAHTRMLAAV